MTDEQSLKLAENVIISLIMFMNVCSVILTCLTIRYAYLLTSRRS